jgi:hypothetical protein
MRCPASIEFEVMWTTASANPLNRWWWKCSWLNSCQSGTRLK